ncbi:MAG: oxygenase MpaB family protein [Brevundimonas sp.]|uniref:oxygenase MpaB family protein n=1 Tax=Brevundimonas sp. TaxID=1871086 RepID=UPI002737635A|nr:oxygenase MpaB family protein [Brevundimonas sp.]MDP3404565.1 oxygenase MpaB family protein [Brevundimonas sp.]
MARPPQGPKLAAQRAIARQIVAMFNDPDKGERPIVRQSDGLFGPDSVAWRVHGDVVGMLVGGVSGLLLQMLHPAVLAGVWDHSNFRSDMHGRLRRTARFIAITTYGGRDEATRAIDRVRTIHSHLGGTLPSGQPYRVSDPELLAWVHVTECWSFLNGWIRYGEPGMSAADQDRYFAEMATMGAMLGADPLPRTRLEARRLIDRMRPQLKVDERTREVARLVLSQPASSRATAPIQAMTLQAGVELLPQWARRIHGLPSPLLARPLVRAGTMGLAKTLRWSFAGVRAADGPPPTS